MWPSQVFSQPPAHRHEEKIMAVRPKPKTVKSTDQVTEALRVRSRSRRQDLATLSAIEGAGHSRRNDLLIDCTSVLVAIDELKQPARRVRKASTIQVARLRKAMLSLGVVTPAIITFDNELVDGESRIAAAREIGLDRYPCLRLPSHYSEQDVRLLRITLNRTQELGEFELPDLAIELRELRALSAPLDITGFTLPEIDQLCLDDLAAAPEQADLEPERVETPSVRPGDLWILGSHKIVCGDSRDPAVFGRLFGGDEPATFVLTDEPYNLRVADLVTSGAHKEFAMASGEMTRDEFAKFNADWIAACLAHLIDGGLLATFIDWRSVEVVLAEGRAAGLALTNIIVWTKTNAGQGAHWRSQHELLPVFKKGDAPHRNNIELGRHGRHRSNVWSYPGATSMGSDAREGLKTHPTVKPVALLEDALLDVTDHGDIILEPFCGSGSTLIAAEKTGRRCRAVEISPAYVEVTLRRWAALTGQAPTLSETGESFDQVVARRTAEAPAEAKPRVRIKAARSKEN